MPTRMVLRLGGQAAHLNDLPGVPASALQRLLTELGQVQVAQFEIAGGGFEQLFGIALGERRDT